MKLMKTNARKRGLLERIDRWLCIYARPLRFRGFWQKLWIREDEFHPSLDSDVEVQVWLASKHPGDYLAQDRTRQAYSKDLIMRRNIIHNRTLDQVPVHA